MAEHLTKLRLMAGETFESREPGSSMEPIIRSRQPVTLAPVDPDKLEPDDIVFVKVRGNFYTHKVYAVNGDQVMIGNNRGHANGWTPKSQVYGIVIAIDGRPLNRAMRKVKKEGDA